MGDKVIAYKTESFQIKHRKLLHKILTLCVAAIPTSLIRLTL